MSEKISIQDVDGKPIAGHYVLRDGIVVVTASDGRTTRGAIEDSMLLPVSYRPVSVRCCGSRRNWRQRDGRISRNGQRRKLLHGRFWHRR
jgi:hypothetical protein